jgi:uncharacterized membrane protein YdbT with pleckstrin-like domain
MDTLREQMPLKKIKILKKTINSIFKSIFGSVFFLLFFSFVYLSSSPKSKYFIIPVLIILLYLILSPIIYFIYNKLYLKKYFYDMTDKYFIIRKGVISNKEITLPFSKITDVYIDQDIFDKIFKLYDFHISTPTEESGKFAHVDGLSKADSEKMKNMVLEKIVKEST